MEEGRVADHSPPSAEVKKVGATPSLPHMSGFIKVEIFWAS
jgi:hypothetical protein